MPGQTSRHRFGRTPRHATFNGGPDNCPARRVHAPLRQVHPGDPSMEGRTIARPDAPLAVSAVLHEHDPSMEGRTIARPDSGVPVDVSEASAPSMEGRTIARPDPVGLGSTRYSSPSLQWRAGQLPGQTWTMNPQPAPASPPFNGGPDNCPARQAEPRVVMGGHVEPSMEGRTIARPDTQIAADVRTRTPPSMEGRTIARPDPHGSQSMASTRPVLQWRAGQLHGQTPPTT